MSHILSGKSQVKCAAIATAAARRCKLDAPKQGSHKIYNDTYEGLGVKPKGWHYPVVFNLETGETKYDNYGGHWGKQEHLDEFQQAYTIEKHLATVRKLGRRVEEKTLADGSIELVIAC